MRLTCPNCDAQYEVDDGVIPDNGRDVQCSACGHTWFQPGAKTLATPLPAADPEDMPDAAEWEAFAAAAEKPAAARSIPEPAAEVPEAETDTEAGFKNLVRPAPGAEPEYDDEMSEPQVAAAASRMLDENLRAILREEAERESRARRTEGSSLETQPDLGLAPIPAALAARAAAVAAPTAEPAPNTARDAQLRPDPADTSTPEGPRRDRLPDIEVINSTLRATSERGNAPASRDAPETRARRRAGFRFGFIAMLLLAALGAGAYGLAPRLKAALPVLEPTLTRYVAAVDAGRLWLDAQMRRAIERMQTEG